MASERLIHSTVVTDSDERAAGIFDFMHGEAGDQQQMPLPDRVQGPVAGVGRGSIGSNVPWMKKPSGSLRVVIVDGMGSAN